MVLIITIIILLILAGVSLSFVFNGGILYKAQMAVNEYEKKKKKEQELLDKIDKYLEKELSVDSNGLAKTNTTIVAKDDPSVQIVIPVGFAPAILMTGTTQSLPGENGAVKEIMPVEDWNNITKEDINRGIVVVDNAITYDGGKTSGTVPDFNEYVWIPMPDNSKFARVAWNSIYYDGSILTNGIHPLAEVSTENAYWEETSSTEYTNMVNSVSINKGFYISRYEASQKDSTTAQSKRGQDPWVNVSQLDAIKASSNMKTSIKSHLIYGIEWDSILQWLIDCGATISSETSGETKNITIDDVQSDSRSWGNYSNAVGDAENNSGGDQAKITGISEYWKVNNIYDLAGNVYELTQEKYSTGPIRAVRGGRFNGNGVKAPVAIRNYANDFGMNNRNRI